MELALTDTEAQSLIELLKNIVKRHVDTLIYPAKGTISIKSFADNQRSFKLMYYFTETKKTFQFLDETTNLTLFRINLNNGFHKNANGERIYGNRINVFSETEYYLKDDGHTHTKSYQLPYGPIQNSENIFEIFGNIFDFTHTQNREFVQITVQEGLDV